MTICQLRHVVRNPFFNFMVVELTRCYFRLTRMPAAILLLIVKYVS